MTPESIRLLRALLVPRFVSVKEKVFVRLNDGTVLVRPGRRQPTTLDENTENHVHFRFFPANTEDRVRDNCALAEAVRIVWQSHLRKQFPRKRFRLFVSNEYQCWPTTRRPIRVADEEVETVLRLWSLPADSTAFDEVYQPDAIGPDLVMWPEYRRNGLVRLSTVLRIMKSTTAHPAKIRTLRERWGAS